MARYAPPDNQAVQQQQAKQQVLTGLMAGSLASAWTLVDLHDLSGTLPGYEQTVAALVRKFGLGSAKLAADFYRQQRQAAGVSGRFLPTLADPANADQVHASVSWATQEGLWTPKAATDQPSVPIEGPQHATNARTLVQGAVQKMVVDTGRSTILEATQADRAARGWVRQARPGACSFCALLSTRGVTEKPGASGGSIYHSPRSFQPANDKFVDDPGDPSTIKVHDHCHCVPVPVFSAHYEAPHYIRQWNQIYEASTKDKSSADARNAFRVALDAHRNPSVTPQPALV